jgi:hypothetical protein
MGEIGIFPDMVLAAPGIAVLYFVSFVFIVVLFPSCFESFLFLFTNPDLTSNSQHKSGFRSLQRSFGHYCGRLPKSRRRSYGNRQHGARCSRCYDAIGV